jgi:hypothetical protein
MAFGKKFAIQFHQHFCSYICQNYDLKSAIYMGRSPVAIRQKKASNFFEQKIRTKMLMKLTTSIKGTKTPLGITLRRLRSDLLSHKLKLILSSDLA